MKSEMFEMGLMSNGKMYLYLYTECICIWPMHLKCSEQILMNWMHKFTIFNGFQKLNIDNRHTDIKRNETKRNGMSVSALNSDFVCANKINYYRLKNNDAIWKLNVE